MSGGADGGAPQDAVTLRQVLAYDEDGIVRLVLAPAGQDTALVGVIIGDEDATRSYDGRIVLVTGVSAESADATAAAVREAAGRGAGAVVVRGRGDGTPDGDVVAAARASGVALLARAGWADWSDTIEMLRAAFAFAAVGTGDRLAGDVAGGGLPGLAAVVARSCQASITVEDTRFRVLAHSATSPEADPLRQSTILGGRVPDWRVAELRRSGLLKALWTSRDVIHRAADGTDPERLVVAVRSGGEILGSIWAAADGRSFSPDAREVLRRAAEVAVPHLLQHRLRVSGNRRREEHALRELLRGGGDRRAHVWSLGLAPELPCVVLVAERDRSTAPVPERGLQALALQAAAHRPAVRVLRESHRLTVLLPVPDGDGREAVTLARELDSLAAAVPDAPAVWIGAGRLVGSPLEAADSREEAVLVVRALREREARRARGAAPGLPGASGAAGEAERPVRHAGPDDVAPTVAVLRVLDAVRPLWQRQGGPVHAMVEADLAAGGELVRSLTAYLDAAGDVPRAARSLVLHPNTLRYRLRRVRERFGVDLDDPDTRLLVTLAVRLATSARGTGEVI
ncbi:PucR family transcriptional regulator [Streptomyces sp. t39]|uniref:PucR family transcriptional regulator n=1 Tax=Streptomyces sp. t39 TaxID=1828156 RepID=UPI0011CD8FEE|nr:helix-turn-helix domain-containing protein [Streptomyces sp. t39]TXS48123.1 PucR family transcriptional regulator [Streptomyces sp. t39]